MSTRLATSMSAAVVVMTVLSAVPVAAQTQAAATRRGVTAAPWTPPKKVAAPCRAMSVQRFHKGDSVRTSIFLPDEFDERFAVGGIGRGRLRP